MLACDVPVTAICDGGGYPSEIRWKIKDPTGNVLVSGEGGESKAFCLDKTGTYTVVGSDTFGDSWNGGSLKVVATSGKVYFGPWNGPTRSDGKAEVTTSFLGPCSAGTYEYNNTCISCPIGRYGIRVGQNNSYLDS